MTIHCYVEDDLTMPKHSVAGLHEPDPKICRDRAPDALIDFLKAL